MVQVKSSGLTKRATELARHVAEARRLAEYADGSAGVVAEAIGLVAGSEQE